MTAQDTIGYPIRAASRMTGISVDSIRAWERRYSAVTPMRVKGGRLYTEQDIQRLRLLKRAVDHGHSIGQIAALDTQNLQQLPLGRFGVNTAVEAEDDDTGRDIETILSYIDDYDMNGADKVLGKLASLLTPREFVHQVVAPLMNFVGRSWKDGRLSVAQEHMISSLMRNILGTLIRLHAKEQCQIKVVFTTPSEELHEFGILISAMLAVAGGLGVIYLGPNLPVNEVIRAVKKTRSSALVMSVTGVTGKETEKVDQLIDIREGIPEKVDMIVGGRMIRNMKRKLHSHNVKWVDDFNVFEEYLKQLGASF